MNIKAIQDKFNQIPAEKMVFFGCIMNMLPFVLRVENATTRCFNGRWSDYFSRNETADQITDRKLLLELGTFAECFAMRFGYLREILAARFGVAAYSVGDTAAKFDAGVKYLASLGLCCPLSSNGVHVCKAMFDLYETARRARRGEGR